jgi:hypothetical protein
MPQEQQKPSESGPSPLVDVAQALRDVARSLDAEPDVQHVLAAIVASVTDTVPAPNRPGCRFAKANSCRPSPRPVT